MKKNWKLRMLIIAVSMLVDASAQADAACVPAPSPGSRLSVPQTDVGSVTLIEQTIVDNARQSSLRQKILITERHPPAAQVRALLAHLFQRARQSCRKHPLQGALIFLYRAPDATDGLLWIGRLDADQANQKIDVKEELIAPKSPQVGLSCTKGKEPGTKLSLGNEVHLPGMGERKVQGTWEIIPELTISIEDVRGKLYSVIRSKYCESGSTGRPLVKEGRKYIESGNSRGKFFMIGVSGDLEAHDHEGYIETYDKQTGLWARM